MTFLDPVIFSIHEILKKDQKVTGSKKFIRVKNQFFHARQPCKGIFEIRSYLGLFYELFSQTFEQLFQIGETFFQKKFWLKSFHIVRTLTG